MLEKNYVGDTQKVGLGLRRAGGTWLCREPGTAAEHCMGKGTSTHPGASAPGISPMQTRCSGYKAKMINENEEGIYPNPH